MKKLVSFLLAVTMVFASVSVAFADNPEYAKSDLASAVSRIREETPYAEIRIVGEVIHIVVEDISDVPCPADPFRTDQTRTTSVNSSTGGSFRNFDVPLSGYLSFAPYSQVYMKKDVVEALKIQMLEPRFYNWVVGQLVAGVATDVIVTLAASLWGMSIRPGIVTAISSFMAWGMSNLEYWSLKSAQDASASGKVYIVRGTVPEGYDSVYYSPWNNNTCVTYAGYDADWYGGVYDV